MHKNVEDSTFYPARAAQAGGKVIGAGVHIQFILTYPDPFVQAKNIFVQIDEKFRYVKCIEKIITECH